MLYTRLIQFHVHHRPSSLPLKGYPSPVFHGCSFCHKLFLLFEIKLRKIFDVLEECHQGWLMVNLPSLSVFSLSFSSGVVSWTAGLALHDWWGLNRTGLLALESRRTSHSQHHWVPCKCEVSVCMWVCIHTHASVFMQMLVWFHLLLAHKEGGPENSQTPEPYLSTPTTPACCMYLAWFHSPPTVSVLSYMGLNCL